MYHCMSLKKHFRWFSCFRINWIYFQFWMLCLVCYYMLNDCIWTTVEFDKIQMKSLIPLFRTFLNNGLWLAERLPFHRCHFWCHFWQSSLDGKVWVRTWPLAFFLFELGLISPKRLSVERDLSLIELGLGIISSFQTFELKYDLAWLKFEGFHLIKSSDQKWDRSTSKSK